MVFVFLLGCVSLFFVMGHGTLLHFMLEEKGEIDIWSLFFPWPQKGKVVSIICLFISIIFLLLILVLPKEQYNDMFSVSSWKIFFVMTAFPLVSYLIFIASLLIKTSSGFAFKLSANNALWRIVLAFGAIVSIVSWLFS